MKENHQKTLTHFHVKLMRNLRVNENFLAPFIQKNILSWNDNEEVLNEGTQDGKNAKFLSILPRCGPYAYNVFLEQLNQHYSWIAEEMETYFNRLKPVIDYSNPVFRSIDDNELSSQGTVSCTKDGHSITLPCEPHTTNSHSVIISDVHNGNPPCMSQATMTNCSFPSCSESLGLKYPLLHTTTNKASQTDFNVNNKAIFEQQRKILLSVYKRMVIYLDSRGNKSFDMEVEDTTLLLETVMDEILDIINKQDTTLIGLLELFSEQEKDTSNHQLHDLVHGLIQQKGNLQKMLNDKHEIEQNLEQMTRELEERDDIINRLRSNEVTLQKQLEQLEAQNKEPILTRMKKMIEEMDRKDLEVQEWLETKDQFLTMCDQHVHNHRINERYRYQEDINRSHQQNRFLNRQQEQSYMVRLSDQYTDHQSDTTQTVRDSDESNNANFLSPTTWAIGPRKSPRGTRKKSLKVRSPRQRKPGYQQPTKSQIHRLSIDNRPTTYAKEVLLTRLSSDVSIPSRSSTAISLPSTIRPSSSCCRQNVVSVGSRPDTSFTFMSESQLSTPASLNSSSFSRKSPAQPTSAKQSHTPLKSNLRIPFKARSNNYNCNTRSQPNKKVVPWHC